MKIRMTSGHHITLDARECPVVAVAKMRKSEYGYNHSITIVIRSYGTDYLTYSVYRFRGLNVNFEAFSGCEGWSPYTAAEGLRNQISDAGFLRPFISRLIRDIAIHPDLTKGELT